MMARGLSFHLLPSNSSGDEDYTGISLREINAKVDKKVKSQRRRRRSKSRKSMSDVPYDDSVSSPSFKATTLGDTACSSHSVSVSNAFGEIGVFGFTHNENKVSMASSRMGLLQSAATHVPPSQVSHDEMPSYSSSIGNNSIFENGSKQELEVSSHPSVSKPCQSVESIMELKDFSPVAVSEAHDIDVGLVNGSVVPSHIESAGYHIGTLPESSGDGRKSGTVSNPWTEDRPYSIAVQSSYLDTVANSAIDLSPPIASTLEKNLALSSLSAFDGRSSPDSHAHQGTLSRSLELRQRYVTSADRESCNDSSLLPDGGAAETAPSTPKSEVKQDPVATKLGSRILLPSFPQRPSDASEALDWERLMSDNPAGVVPIELSPWRYMVNEFTAGSSLKNTSSAGNEMKRQYVYNTMFHVPWRCELLINIGFFVCLDSFLSLFTIMPARILMFLVKRIANWRQFRRPYADELSDFWCLLVMVLGVALLQQADISYIYHSIRFQSSIKLYVVYNVLEIFDKLCQSFGGDVLQVLFNSAVAVSTCSSEGLLLESLRFLLDQTIAILCFMLHCLIILSEAITVSAAINPANNALLMLLISNNFAEIKSNVFKRVAKDNLHTMAYHEGNWVKRFMFNATMVLACEVLVDVIKHSFLAKFNDIKPVAFSDFLQALCKQTLNLPSHEGQKRLTFVPIAPACVVVRVLIPLYAAYLPQSPYWWRSLSILTLVMATYALLCVWKVVVGIGLQMHAKWYLERCHQKERHLHAD
ncbi:hypothetical protein O6H91_01G129100 [Diphasiastrum complanatum]|uniref:Uncharacterized protein n=1 Tax=Diphasiastrum complanatum TaxID=34168 RepID=A0ACC2EVU9_DIPCM|nr:hypothetical protein O6H91_01G129100 [Diphasiastrum complanatum]